MKISFRQLIHSARQLFSPPSYLEDDQVLVARLILMVEWVIILLFALVTLTGFILSSVMLKRFIFALSGILVINLSIIFLVRSGRLNIASILAIFFPWLFTTYLTFTAGGVEAASYPAFFLIAFLSVLILDKVKAVIAVAVIITTGLVSVFLENAGIVPSIPLFAFPPVIDWAISAVIMAIILVLMLYAREINQRNLAGARQELRERILAQKAQRESEDRFSTLFKESHESILIMRLADGIILDVNQAFCNTYEISRDQLIGHTPGELATDFPGLGNMVKQVSTAVDEQQQGNREFQYQDRSGSDHWVILSSRVTNLAGEQCLVIFTRDITGRRMAEIALENANSELEKKVLERTKDLQESNINLEKAIKVKDELFSTVSQELRTPLTGVLGLAQALQLDTYGELNDKQLVIVKNIEDNGNRLLQLVKSMLDYTYLQGGSIPVEIRECSLETLCTNIIRSLTSAVDEKGLTMVNNSSRGGMVKTDERRLHMVISQLLSNAIKFTPDGGVLGIDVNVKDADHSVDICVWDKGIGISRKDLDRLFFPFYKIDSALARKNKGSGLGLALAKLNAGLIGGELSVTSEVGKGSRFTLTIPMEYVPA